MAAKTTILLISLLLVPLVAGPAFAETRNKRVSVLETAEVATGTPVTRTINNVNHATGYLLVKTENETPDASLVVTVFNTNPLGDFLICTTGAITTETTTVIMLGHWAVANRGIHQVCEFPMSESVKFTFTTSGGGADFDTTANIEWIDPGV